MTYPEHTYVNTPEKSPINTKAIKKKISRGVALRLVSKQKQDNIFIHKLHHRKQKTVSYLLIKAKLTQLRLTGMK